MVDTVCFGQRLDRYLVDQQPSISRSLLASLIRCGQVNVDGCRCKAALRLKGGETVDLVVPPPEPVDLVSEDLSFPILHEDEDLLVLVKPPGMVVHPACGHRTGTLVHGLLSRCTSLSSIGGEQRPGIVHRLDRDTSGVMVVAKNDTTHHALSMQFQRRQVHKVYHAIIDGRPAGRKGRIAAPIGRHPVSRKKMSVCPQGGREAVTRWKVLEELTASFTYVEVRPETGRTHQIRVHMAYQGHPVVADPLYGKKNLVYGTLSIPRLCLHALQLSFRHPASGEVVEFVAPLWPDMAAVLVRLRSGR